jgi:hypothetical protein
MKASALPQPVMARLVDFTDRCEALEVAAKLADADVDHLRHVLASKSNDVSAEQFSWAKNNFQRVYTECQTKRVKANTQAKLLSTVKGWIEKLPDNISLIMAMVSVNGIDLTKTRAELKEAREALRITRGNPPASKDIEARVQNYVRDLARAAVPVARGYAAGQTLQLTWPLNVYDGAGNTGLLALASADPDAVGALIMKAILKEQPLNQAELAERVADLDRRIDDLSYVVASLAEKAGAEYDDALLPAHILGVRVGEAETAQAAE